MLRFSVRFSRNRRDLLLRTTGFRMRNKGDFPVGVLKLYMSGADRVMEAGKMR